MLFKYRRHALPTIVALALLLGPASISAQPSQSSRGGSDTGTGSAVESPQAATPASTVASTNCLSVAETLDGISGLNFATIYAVALEEQGFRRFVESISPVTVLVPTDEAFRNLAELYPELSLVDILDDDYFIQRVLQFHIIPEIAEREELQVLGSRFPTLDGRSTVSVVGAEEDENEDGSDTNGDNNGATRLRGAVGSHANLLGDIYLRNICPEIRMHFIDNVLLPPQGDVDQWQQRRRSILPPSTVQDMSPPAAAQNNQQEQNNNGGVREPSFTIDAPPGGDRAQSGRQRNGGANRNGDNSAARSQEAEDEIEEVSSSLPFGISSAVVPPPGTSSPPPAPAPVGFPLFGGGGGAGFGGAGFPAFLGGGGGSPPAGGAPGGGMFGGGGPAGGLFGGPGGAFGGAGGFGGGAPGFGGAGGTGFGGGPFFGAGGGRRRLRGSV